MEGTTLIIATQQEVVTVQATAGIDVRPGDIVELLADERSRATDLRVLVRPALPPANHDASPARHPDISVVLAARSTMHSRIREFFHSRGFIEVPTPTLVPSPGMESTLTGFSTSYEDHTGFVRTLWLPTSPEFALKRALCGGMERIFEIRPVFRNRGEMGPLHHPEFTMLEWYRAYEDYHAIMQDTEELVSRIARSLCPLRDTTFRGVSLRWEPPFPRLSVAEAFIRYSGIDLLAGLEDKDEFSRCCAGRLSHVSAGDDFCTLFHRIMVELIEPHLGLEGPLVLYDYPLELAALSVPKRNDPRLCERFELYVAGVELANAFTEVNDPREMALRIRQARAEQKNRGLAPTPVDAALLQAMRRGMPPAGGIALGLDRLLMVMLGVEHICGIAPFSLHDEHSLSQRTGRLA
ncbi:EF-P lysine aminoacylase GenX [Candidatus Fermentibacteria bacterium]|nr:EF-P lysine aminoacylase GenX [Candidatus Fermentibacteria bacterium]